MVVLDSTRLVIPTSSQKTVLAELHRAHSGMTKTYATATQLYYWPGMKNCIRTFLSKCATCQKFSASQARTPVTGTAPSAAKFPMNNLGMDLFDAAGKKWLAVVCRFSGYAWLSLLKKTTTAYILQTLDSLFTEYGFPSVIRSDGRPQFRLEFDEYCKKNSIKHELSSPYNPESNGLAESAVKNLKSIILRCEDTGEDVKSSIAAWRNMVRADGSSPSQMFFGRTQKQKLPLLNPNATSFNPDSLIRKRDDLHSKRCNLRDQHSVIIADLVPGEKVLIQ